MTFNRAVIKPEIARPVGLIRAGFGLIAEAADVPRTTVADVIRRADEDRSDTKCIEQDKHLDPPKEKRPPTFDGQEKGGCASQTEGRPQHSSAPGQASVAFA
jgi:hypothetical protein